MLRHILRRTLEALLVLLLVAVLIFLMFRVVPGNPIATMMGEHVNTAAIERMTAELGLDQPITVQFFPSVLPSSIHRVGWVSGSIYLACIPPASGPGQGISG